MVVIELVNAEYLGSFDIVYRVIPYHQGLPFDFFPCFRIIIPADA